MRIFSDKTLTENQISNLNKILPENLQKETWKESDFKGQDSIFIKIENNIKNLSDIYRKDLELLNQKSAI